MDWNFEHQMSLTKSIQTVVYIFKVRCSIAVSKMTTDLNKMTTDLSKMTTDLSKMTTDLSKMTTDLSKMTTDSSNGRKRNCKQHEYDHNDCRLYDC